MSELGASTESEEQACSFTRELGLTYAEFYRSLPPAIDHHAFTVENDRVQIDYGARTVSIELGPQQHRKIASLQLPFVEVRFTFTGFGEVERRAFMARFERSFQRGGG